jgi:hypothetical protein
VDRTRALVAPFLPTVESVGKRYAELPYPTEDQLGELNESYTNLRTVRGRLAVLGGPEVIYHDDYLYADQTLVQARIDFLSSCHTDLSPNPACNDLVEDPNSVTSGANGWTTGQHGTFRENLLQAMREELEIPD